MKILISNRDIQIRCSPFSFAILLDSRNALIASNVDEFYCRSHYSPATVHLCQPSLYSLQSPALN